MPTPRTEPLSQSLRALLHFGALLCLPLAALLARYVEAAPPSGEPLATLFLAASVGGHAVTLAALVALLALPLAFFPGSRRALLPAALLLALLLGLTLVVDWEVYRLYRFHLNAMVWELLTGGAAGQMLDFGAKVYALAAAWAVGLFLLLWPAVLLARRFAATKRGGPAKVLLALFLGALLVANGLHAWAQAAGYTPVTRLARLLPAYRPLTARHLLRALGMNVAQAAKVRPPGEEGGTLRYPAEPLRYAEEGTGLNVLTILIDGWRADALTERTTPHIAAFAQHSLTFADHWSTGNATRFGVFGYFYGLYGPYWQDILGEMRPPALIDAALHRGYDFAVFASAKLTSPEFDRTVFAPIRDRIPLETPGETVVERDREITRRFLDYLDAHAANSPFFGVLFYDSPHGYAFPEGKPPIFTPMAETIDYMALDAESDPLPILNRLRTSYHFVDEEVGRVLDALERRGLLDDTVVIVTSDHGEELNDAGQNYWGHNSNFSPAQLRVPLLIRWPGRESRRYTQRTSHADIAPTLLTGVFGVENASAALGNGRLLTDETPRPAIIAASWESYAVITAERIDVVLPAAGIESRRASDYGEWTDPAPDRAEFVTAMEELSRFYRR